MSRRKQSRPRHVDDPDLDSPAIAANSVVSVFSEDATPEEEAKLETPADDLKELEGEIEENQDRTNGDAHVCGKCRAEFLDIDEFVAHKKECGKPVVLFFKDIENQEEEASESCRINGVSPNAFEDNEVNNFESMSQGGGSDGDNTFENVGVADDIDANANPENFENQSDLDNMEDDFSKSVEAGENNETDSLKDENLKEDLKGDKASDLPSYMQSLSNLLPGGMGTSSNSNVLLEPLEATKAAVAQFAENNLPDEDRDVNRLQNALYTLQQQQLMQLQLIQQLQHQLVNGGGIQNSQLSAALLNGQLPLQGLNLSLPGLAGAQGKLDPASKSSSSRDSPAGKELSTDTGNEKAKETTSRPGSPHQSAEGPVDGDAKSSTTSPSPASSLFNSPTFKPQSTTASSSSTNPALDYSRSSSKGVSESSSFLSSDDPFFKHKCRLCHKVFGSDSALQIHVRSHTDPTTPHHAFFVDVPLGPGAALSTSELWTCEKPFQCNICGGRFSTRGNLKVHFQRHKAEFPNVEMNPNPVPEHLDKNPMPLLGSQFPAAALTPFANPAFMGMQGLMNGFMFPPPHLAPRPPMVGPGMMPKHSPQSDRRLSSPSKESHHDVKKEVSPSHPGKEIPQRPSPDSKEGGKIPHNISTSSSSIKSSPMSMPMSSIPLVSNYPVMSPLPSHPPFSQHQRSHIVPPTSMANSDPFRTTILPSNILDNDDNLEQFMEINKSETSKLQQLVDNIEHKLTDPNQCVICHRVLSCKSALQMHYRIHTGERPFKCKICGRCFTTKGNLKTHMGVHRAKPPLRMMHQCPVCHKQFTNLLVLQQHIRSHTGMSTLPTMPGLGHLGMYSHHAMEDYQPSPLNMKRQYTEEFDKELDLSKKPRLERDAELEKNERDEKISEADMMDAVTNGNEDDSDDDEQNEMDDEANKLAAYDARKVGLNRESSEGRSTPEDSNDGLENKPDEARPKSNNSEDALGFSNSIPRSSSPKYLQEDSNTSQEGSFNAYSTSLAALEERVRAIDTTMARNPLSQFHAAPFLLAPSHYPNGDRALSPRSESGSENGDKDGRKPGTPALSVSSEGSLGSNFMIGAMDGRSSESGGKTTTCNVCYKTFACRSALDIHYRSHTKERPYKCDLCDKSFTTRGNMKQHLLTHKADGSDGGEFENNNNNSCTPNQNDNDSDKSNDSSQFEESRQEISAKSSSESQVIPKKETTSPSQKPSSSSSTPSSSLPSATPNRSSSSSYPSSDNQSPFVSKTPQVKHQCLVCQKGFSSASALQIHIRTHTGDKPFKCTVCGKAFTTKGNLKVHMGTHMWNNSPSRRGRRMSIEPPFMLAHKENPYLPHGFPPRPDFYPFQFPPFMNGLPTPPKSLSEMSMMSSVISNSVNLKPELPSPRGEHNRPKPETSPLHEDKPKFAESGELDLSMKSTGSSGSRSSEKTSPSSVDSNSSSGMVSPPHTSLGWGWKASCHLCSRTFPTTAALEHHIRNMHLLGDSLPKVAAS